MPHFTERGSDDAIDLEDANKTPIHTRPLEEEQRGVWFDGPDSIVALGLYEGDGEFTLPQKETIIVGASRSCDIVIPSLSARHCILEHRGGQLRCRDLHSTNGTFVGGRRISVVDLYPGDILTAAPVPLLALNSQMQKHRPVIADILGVGSTPSPDHILVLAAKHFDHQLIVGETGCDQDRLARALHEVSLRRGRPLVEVSEVPSDRGGQREIIRRAARSSLVIDLSKVERPLDATFCAMAFAPEYHVCVIALAPTAFVARRLLPHDSVASMRQLWARPLAARPGEILGLLDRMLVERGCLRRVADLTPPNQESLRAGEWRTNFIGLRSVADRLTAIASVPNWEETSWVERSALTGLAQSTLWDWFKIMKLTPPVFSRQQHAVR